MTIVATAMLATAMTSTIPSSASTHSVKCPRAMLPFSVLLALTLAFLLIPTLAFTQGPVPTDDPSPLDGSIDTGYSEQILYFEEGKRRALDFYRNAIVNYFAAPSFMARRLLTGPSLGELREDVAEWLDLFCYEFFTPRGEVLAAHLEAFLDHFERFGWVERSDGQLLATEKGRDHFAFLAEQTRGVVEVYYATCGAVLGAEGPLTAKGLQEAASAQFDRADLLGEVVRPEAANRITFGNAIDLLVRRHVLERAESADRKGDIAYVRGPAFDDLATLHERLATALAAG